MGEPVTIKTSDGEFGGYLARPAAAKAPGIVVIQEIFTYPGRDHAFARPGGEHYDAADAGKANERTLAFFAKALA